MKKVDVIAGAVYKNKLEKYAIGTLKSSSGADVNGPKQALAIAASESGQSYNEKAKQKHDRYGMRK